MDRMFMSRQRAVARIVSEQALLRQHASAGTGPTAEEATRAQQLERLLFDVRAGRLAQFVLPADRPLHVFVTSE